ncbi:MAG: transcription termination factor NusA [Mycoplasma sp.]|nr:transcription termination factor NusA [Mycoplasma sp.]
MKNKINFFEFMDHIKEKPWFQNDTKILEEILLESIKKVYHGDLDPDAKIRIIFDNEKNEVILLNSNLEVVEDEDFSEDEASYLIPLKKAQLANKDVKVGDTIEFEIDFNIFDKKQVSKIRQHFIQLTRSEERKYIYEKFLPLKGTVQEAIFKGDIGMGKNGIFEINGTKAFMPSKFRNVKIEIGLNEKTKVFVEEVLEEAKDAQIIVSNGSPKDVVKAFEEGVPEVADGTIELVSIARQPGIRSKVVVKSNNPNIEPVGSCVGNRGDRINAISRRLGGERIDLIAWSPVKEKYIAAAISPSRVIGVNILDENHAQIIVPNSQFTLAIGRGGRNQRLVSELLNMKIDLYSQEKATNEGINITWNGNIADENELNMINDNANNNRRTKPWQGNKRRESSFDDIDRDIESFNDDFTNANEDFDDIIIDNSDNEFPYKRDERPSKPRPKKPRTNNKPMVEEDDIDLSIEPDFATDVVFSDEEIAKMEADFEFDNEL